MIKKVDYAAIKTALVCASLAVVTGCANVQEDTTDQETMPMQGQMQQMREQMMSQMRDCMGMRTDENEEMQGMQRRPMGTMSDEDRMRMRQQMMGRMQNCMQQMQEGEDETNDSSDK